MARLTHNRHTADRSYSITSSARASSEGGTSRPSALGALTTASIVLFARDVEWEVPYDYDPAVNCVRGPASKPRAFHLRR
jgi:hypothetical protein